MLLIKLVKNKSKECEYKTRVKNKSKELLIWGYYMYKNIK